MTGRAFYPVLLACLLPPPPPSNPAGLLREANGSFTLYNMLQYVVFPFRLLFKCEYNVHKKVI